MSPRQVVQDVLGAILVIVIVSVQHVREKKDLHDSEHDQQLEQDNLPQCAPESHVAEAVQIKLKNFIEHKSTQKTILVIYMFF